MSVSTLQPSKIQGGFTAPGPSAQGRADPRCECCLLPFSDAIESSLDGPARGWSVVNYLLSQACPAASVALAHNSMQRSRCKPKSLDSDNHTDIEEVVLVRERL